MNCKSTPFIKDLLQDTDQFILPASCRNRIINGQMDLPLVRIGNICPFENIIFYRTVILQFKQNAVPVQLHQLLRRILT